MKAKKTVINAVAVMTAAMMMLVCLTLSAAESADWMNLTITLTRYSYDGEIETYEAHPVTDLPGSFWVCVPAGISFQELLFNAEYPGHEDIMFIPGTGQALSEALTDPYEYMSTDMMDASDQLNDMTAYLTIMAFAGVRLLIQQLMITEPLTEVVLADLAVV